MSEERTLKIGKKEYVVPTDDHPVWNLFNEAIKKSDNYDSIMSAKFRIVFVSPLINKRTVARIRRANPLYQLFDGCDYIIEISADYWQSFNNDVRAIVLEHELDHAIGVEDEKSGEMKYRTLDHNFKDFYSIIQNYGMNWLNQCREVAVTRETSNRQDTRKRESAGDSRTKAEELIPYIKL